MIEAIKNRNKISHLDRIQSFRIAKKLLDGYYWKNETTELRTIVSGMQLSSNNIAADANTMHTWCEAVESVRQRINKQLGIADKQSAEDFIQSVPVTTAFLAVGEYMRTYNNNWKSEQLSGIIADIESAQVANAGIDSENAVWLQWLDAIASDAQSGGTLYLQSVNYQDHWLVLGGTLSPPLGA